MKLNRRQFLYSIGAGAAALRFSSAASAQDVSASRISDSISLITGAGNNIVSLKSEDGSLLVDCGDAAHSRDVLQAAGRVKTVINTHWHLESTGANETMSRAGAKIISHVNTQLWMTQETVHNWEHKTYPARPKEAWPTDTFYTSAKTVFAGEPVEYGLMPLAHTDGDIYVYFPQSNVLVVGDAVQIGRLPVLDWMSGGWIGGMQDANRKLLALSNDSTRIVPASGPVITKSQLQGNLDVLTNLRVHLTKLMKQGMGPQDMINAKAVAEFQPELAGDAAVFLFEAYRGLWGHVRELGGIT